MCIKNHHLGKGQKRRVSGRFVLGNGAKARVKVKTKPRMGCSRGLIHLYAPSSEKDYGGEKKIPAPQEGARCRKIKQTYYEKTRIKI